MADPTKSPSYDEYDEYKDPAHRVITPWPRIKAVIRKLDATKLLTRDRLRARAEEPDKVIVDQVKDKSNEATEGNR